ncbi:large exoprotein involved in heme utilization and adhesion [Streptacidiphilus sp. MAP12-16]|jgi:hypothetical protein|uniref:hypothetical protein n=1 Tax=Streptacidiphilus sp. MAP12-16 TaxID=3156300 RepID=UPI003514FE64
MSSTARHTTAVAATALALGLAALLGGQATTAQAHTRPATATGVTPVSLSAATVQPDELTWG